MQSQTETPVTAIEARGRVSHVLQAVARLAGPGLRALELLLWVTFFALAIAFLALRYWFLPNVERYRGEIVAAVSQAIGLKVTVSSIEASWRGMWPQLKLGDVRVYDRDGRVALVLPTVENVVAWRSLVHGDLRLHSLAIDGPRVTLRRDLEGAIYIAGIKLDESKGEGKLADWILSQREIEIRSAEIDWVDEQRGAPRLALSRLNFRLRNDGDQHLFGLSARPPAELGSSLELRAALTGRSVNELKSWNGQVFAELGYTDLAGWRAWVDYPIEVRKGQGAVRLWASLAQGKLTRATADLALTGVLARLAKDLPALDVSSVHGRLQGRETARGYEFGARNLALVSGLGPQIHATSFQASWERGDDKRPPRGLVNADLIELGPLAHLIEFVPIPADVRKAVVDLAPHGNLLDVKFDWAGELPEAEAFNLKTRFAGLEMNAWRTVPGFSGLSGSVEASERKGVLHLASEKAALDLPKVFPDPRITFDQLNGEFQWERQSGAAVAVRISNLSYANDDLAGTATGTYLYPGQAPGVIDLSAQLARVSSQHIARYLPLGTIMGPATREWVATSVKGGQSTDVRLRLKGDLRDFPFADASKGQFQVAARVTGGVLEYADGWPRIEDVDCSLLFERDRMDIIGRSGSILGAKIHNVRVSIPSMRADRTMLLVNGNAEGPTAEFLKYIRQSPVRSMIDGFTDAMSATGNGRLQLRLDLPLADLGQSRIAGEYQFQNNTTTVDPRLPPIERASGRLSFTESTLTLHEARGQLFGGPLTLSGGSNAEAGVAIVAHGETTVAGMRALFDHPWLARLSGSAPYSATLSVKGGRTRISFDTPLRGVSSELPPPLGKIAAEMLPLRVDLFPAEGRDRISLTLGTIVAAEFLRVKQAGEMQVQRTAVALSPAAGEALRVPERPGVAIYGVLPALDLDRWRPFLGSDGGTGASSLDLRIGTLDVLGKRLHNVVLRGGADASGWSANVSASELGGDLTYRAEGNGRLTARLAHFRIPDDYPGAKPVDSSKELPAVDLIAENFTHRGRRFGRVEVGALQDGPNWRIEKLVVVNPEASVSGSGAWRTGGASRTSLSLALESSDVGKFLERIGYPDRVQGGSAKLEGNLEWNGDPLSVDYASLSGELSLSAEKGQFPRIESSGLGRLVSLISLNVTDATAKGFLFDSVSSSFQIAGGVMNTKDLKIRGSSAEVTASGDINLEKETQNLRVRVVPSMRRGVTALATIVNPAVAVGIAVAQNVLKDPLGQILSYEYSVSGSWAEPKVESIATANPPSDASRTP